MSEIDRCHELLSQGLDLCVRARKLDAQERANTRLANHEHAKEWEGSGGFARHAERYNIERPHAPIAPKSGTIHLWVQDQYEKDLYEWEKAAREYLQKAMS